MTTLISKNETSLKLLRAYIAWIKDLYADDLASADNLLLVLRIYEWQLGRYAIHQAATLENMSTLKHGIRQAELILRDVWENEAGQMLGWYMGCKPTNQAQRLANLLWELIMAFTQEIAHTEAQFPEMKSEFDRERAEYRKMLNDRDEAMR